jgi:hypothetical protein
MHELAVGQTVSDQAPEWAQAATRLTTLMPGSVLAAGLVALSVGLPGAVLAQERWSASTYDSGTYLFGFAVDPGGSLSIGCTAPSAQGRPAIETGSHESHHTGPYGVILGFHDSLFDWPSSFRVETAAITVDQTGYRLPPVALDELLGTAVYLSMADPMVQALYTASRLVLDTGTGKAYEYNVSGLPQALDEAMLHCINRWVETGQPIPAALTRYKVQAEAPQLATATPAPQQGFATPPTAPPAAEAHIRGLCQGDYDVKIEGIQSADFDGDGAGDFLLNWNDVTCLGPIGARPFCGAANCQIDIFMSSLGYAPAPAFLGTSTEVVTLSDGRSGFMLGGSLSLCSQGACDRPWAWNGREFIQ